MLSNSWNKTEGESISQKVIGKVKPDEPLKNRIDFAQKKLQAQISKLSGINEKLQTKHDKIFEKIVNAQRNNKPAYAQAYAGELTQVRKMKNMVSGAKLSMEQVKLRLDTVSELGDVVVTLSPLIIELESKVAITVTPKIAIQNICDGPNLSAKFANTGVKKIKIIIPITPPMKELIKQ